MFVPPIDPSDPPVEVEPFTKITVPMCFYHHAGPLRRLFAPPWYIRAANFLRRLFKLDSL